MSKKTELTTVEYAIALLGTCGVIAVVVFCLNFLLAWLVQGAWNYVVPPVFHGPTLTYLQTLVGLWLLWALGAVIHKAIK